MDINMVKDPDKESQKLRTLKIPLKSILRKHIDIGIIEDVKERTNQIVINSYQFIRAYVLHQYYSKSPIDIITHDSISMVFKTLLKPGPGPKPKGENALLVVAYTKFYNDYLKNRGIEIMDGNNLSFILGYMATDMLTNIENNIKLNFIKYINRFVNSSFKKMHQMFINDFKDDPDLYIDRQGEFIYKNKIDELKLTKTDMKLKYIKYTKDIFKKSLRRELKLVKEDLLQNNDPLKSSEMYHPWIKFYKKQIIPNNFDPKDVDNNPQKYLKYMIKMCLILEDIGASSFQFIPQRNDGVAKYIPLDTATLIGLFVEKDQNKYFSKMEEYKKDIWDNIVDLKNPIFNTSASYKFDYRILTDGIGCSIQFIHKSYIKDVADKKAKMRKSREEAKLLYKDKKNEEIKKIKYERGLKRKEQEIKKRKEEKDKYKTYLNSLTPEQKNKHIIDLKNQKQKSSKLKSKDFLYLEDLNDDQYKELQEGNWCVVDPGKRVLLYMKNKKGDLLRYTNREHIFKTKRVKYQNLIRNYKRDIKILEGEKILNTVNSKTCNFNKYLEFIETKNKVNEKLKELYKDVKFRIYKWYSYINKQKTKTFLRRKISKKFGKDVIICHGDWSVGNNQMKNYISTPNLGLKRELQKNFKVYNVDEYKTSLINSKTKQENENMHLPDENGKIRLKHSILTYQMENNRLGCINRDRNAVSNMVSIVTSYLTDKTRPPEFSRKKENTNVSQQKTGGT